MADLLLQYQRRTPMDLVDAHGRTWNTVIDITDKRWGNCGPIMPRDFVAPWVPEQKYLKADGRTRSLVIDYDACIADCEDAAKAWDERLHQTAVAMFAAKAPQAISERNPTLMREVGPEPMSPLLPKAAKAGNPWLLGKAGYRMPELLAPIFAAPLARQQAEIDALAYAEPDLTDVDALEDLSEQYDPRSTGGTKVKAAPKRRAEG